MTFEQFKKRIQDWAGVEKDKDIINEINSDKTEMIESWNMMMTILFSKPSGWFEICRSGGGEFMILVVKIPRGKKADKIIIDDDVLWDYRTIRGLWRFLVQSETNCQKAKKFYKDNYINNFF